VPNAGAINETPPSGGQTSTPVSGQTAAGAGASVVAGEGDGPDAEAAVGADFEHRARRGRAHEGAVAHEHADRLIRRADIEEVGVDPCDCARSMGHRAHGLAARDQRVACEHAPESHGRLVRIDRDDVHDERPRARRQTIADAVDAGRERGPLAALREDRRKRRGGRELRG